MRPFPHSDDRRRALTRCSVLAFALSLAAACGGSDPVAPPPPCTVSGVTLASTALSLVAGTSGQITATVTSSNCTATPTVAWSSGTVAVATVSPAGIVTAVAPGTATLTAIAGGVSAQATVTVTPVPVASVTVALSPDTVVVGDGATAVATARDASNGVLADRTATWSSANPAIATIDATTGAITSVSPGTVTIRANVEGIEGSAPFVVRPVPVASIDVALSLDLLAEGEAADGTATARDAQGNVLAGRTISWSATNPSVATVDSATGAITAIGTGTTTIRGQTEGRTGSATLRVVPVPESARFAFAWINPPSSPIDEVRTPSAPFSRNATGGAIRFLRRAVGSYDVTFEGLAKADAARNREVVLVSAYGTTPASCVAWRWQDEGTRDLLVRVRCASALGGPLDAPFTVAVVGSNSLGGAHGFLLNDANAGSVPEAFSFGTGGAATAVARQTTGSYQATIGAAPLTRSTAFTAAFGIPFESRCYASGWSQVEGRIAVRCSELSSATAQDSRFVTLMLDQGRAGRRWGYVWNDQMSAPLDTDYTPDEVFQRTSSGGKVSVRRTGTGVYRVTFEGLGSASFGETAFVMPYGATSVPGPCQVQIWAPVGPDLQVTVRCFTAGTGALADSRFALLILA